MGKSSGSPMFKAHAGPYVTGEHFETDEEYELDAERRRKIHEARTAYNDRLGEAERTRDADHASASDEYVRRTAEIADTFERTAQALTEELETAEQGAHAEFARGQAEIRERASA